MKNEREESLILVSFMSALSYLRLVSFVKGAQSYSSLRCCLVLPCLVTLAASRHFFCGMKALRYDVVTCCTF